MKNNSLGFTLVELVVVVGVISMLFGLAVFSFPQTQSLKQISSSADILVSDIALQQTKAMLGAGTSSGTDYGIYFSQDRYILFKGSSFSSSDITNYTVNLDNLAITNIKFPGNTLVFTSSTGTVSGYLNGSDSVTIQNLEGTKFETIKVNKYGVVIGEN